jgi:uncharacterized protein with FMN-binding domain
MTNRSGGRREDTWRVDPSTRRTSPPPPDPLDAPQASTTSKRISRKLVALSSAAILSVYSIGYVRTQAAEQQLTAGTVPQPAQPDAAGQGSAPAAPTAQVTQAPTKSGAYRDGTYTGSGSSRHGGIEASVVISGGKISSVQITQCLTRYPCSWIADLPGEVVSAQSVKINMVSGATDSSRAFIGAVTQALSYAK